jgi:predicted alpha/beta hydrolase
MGKAGKRLIKSAGEAATLSKAYQAGATAGWSGGLVRGRLAGLREALKMCEQWSVNHPMVSALRRRIDELEKGHA